MPRHFSQQSSNSNRRRSRNLQPLFFHRTLKMNSCFFPLFKTIPAYFESYLWLLWLALHSLWSDSHRVKTIQNASVHSLSNIRGAPNYATQLLCSIPDTPLVSVIGISSMFVKPTWWSAHYTAQQHSSWTAASIQHTVNKTKPQFFFFLSFFLNSFQIYFSVVLPATTY